MKQFHHLLLLLTIIVVTGCSGSGSPSPSDVPADADYLAVVDLQAITAIDKGGNRQTVLPFLTPELAAVAPAIEKAADLKSVLVYKTPSMRQSVAAVGITDEKAFAQALTDAGWRARKFDGFNGFEQSEAREFSPCIVMERGAAWMLATRTDLPAWKQSFSDASKADFGSIPGIGEALEKESQLTAFIAAPYMGISETNAIIRVTAALSADSITAHASLVSTAEENAGETVPFTPLSTIDSTGFLEYMPAGQTLTAAIGVKPGMNWGGLLDLIGSGIGTQNQGMLQTLLPYMNALNGTLAIGVGPFTAKSLTSTELEDQSLILYAPLTPGKAEEAIAEINSNLQAKGLTPRANAEGIYAYTLGDVRYRYTVRDGVFLFALNQEIVPHETSENSFAGIMGGAFVTLPPLRSIVPSAQKDISIRSSLRLTSAGLELIIVSDGASPLTAISSYFDALDSAARAEREASDDYYETYD